MRTPAPRPMDVTAIVIAMTDAEAPYAREAILSVVQQSVRPDAIRVYVQHSNAWIDALVADLPGVHIHRIALTPPGAVRNIAAQEAHTTWLAYLDGDDLWAPQKQAQQIAAAQRGGDLVGCDYYLTDAQGQQRVAAVCRNIPSASTWLVLRELMLRCPFAPSWRHEDACWWETYRAWTFSVRLPQALSAYRIRPNSVSNGAPGKRRKLRVLRWSDTPITGPLVRAAASLMHAAYRAHTYPAPPAFR